ncbi:serine hydrolase [Demetria terragena]|uniref:serine hydrolase n=1 Tax=Demetria terragena TaxID=63959 RepID=UPI00036602A3|nr:serine hydrolase [Demetria terragena]
MSLQWSILVQPLPPEGSASSAETPDPPWLVENPDEVLRTASVGKCLLLSEAARQIGTGQLDADRQIRWQDEEFVRDSGLWSALDQRDITVRDACRLIGAVSDNLATNVLIREIGLDPVAALASAHDLAPMALLDRVREDRDPSLPGHAETLSVASARSLVRWLTLVHEGTLDRGVLDWLALGTDLSMVASAFGLDPLAHTEADRDVLLINKTGTISTARADIGLVTVGARTAAYAVVANWSNGDDPRDEVLARMADIGRDIRARLGA